MSEPSIFTRIINGEIPAHRIYEDDRVIAFLTIQPVSYGHTLVVPKKQIDQIWDMHDDDYHYLWDVTKRISKHLQTITKVDRVGVIIKGFDVPHVHIHLIPVNINSHISFDPSPEPVPVADNAKLDEIASLIKM